MSEEQTERLNNENTFQEQVLAGLASLTAGMTALNTRMAAIEGRVASLEMKMEAFDARLTALEEKVDARLRETRPIWEAVQSQLKLIDSKFDVFAHEWLEMRGDIELLKKRVPPAA